MRNNSLISVVALFALSIAFGASLNITEDTVLPNSVGVLVLYDEVNISSGATLTNQGPLGIFNSVNMDAGTTLKSGERNSYWHYDANTPGGYQGSLNAGGSLSVSGIYLSSGADYVHGHGLLNGYGSNHKLMAYENYAEFSGNGWTWAGGATGGSASNLLFTNGAWLRTFSNEKHSVTLNNVAFDIPSYEKGLGNNQYQLTQRENGVEREYVLDLSRVVSHEYNAEGAWSTGDGPRANIEGNFTVMLDKALINEILMTADRLIVQMGLYTSDNFPLVGLNNNLEHVYIADREGNVVMDYSYTNGRNIIYEWVRIPEPSSGALALVTVLGLALRRRR